MLRGQTISPPARSVSTIDSPSSRCALTDRVRPPLRRMISAAAGDGRQTRDDHAEHRGAAPAGPRSLDATATEGINTGQRGSTNAWNTRMPSSRGSRL